jgi:predicted transcriptional regulator
MASHPSARAERRVRGALETEVLATLASAEAPLTPSAVLGRLGGDLAYTTVMTTLARLNAKGKIGRERIGRAFAYSIVDGATATARQMRRVMDASDYRDLVLARFLDELEPQDLPLLQRLLAGRLTLAQVSGVRLRPEGG